MSADNQQERPDWIQADYITGFVDGEGCFSITIQKSNNVKLGIQVIPEFHVSQNSDRTEVLDAIKSRWNCGYIKENDRRNPRDMTSVYVVRNINDIRNKVIPFFDRYPIFSSKKQDFEKFKIVVGMMKRQEHLNKKGLIHILEIAFSMNANGKYRKLKLENLVSFLESSETIR